MNIKAILIFFMVLTLTMILIYHLFFGEALDSKLVIRAVITSVISTIVVVYIQKRKSKKK